MNFMPKMEYETLITGYGHIINTIYSPKEYYGRIYTFLSEYQPTIKKKVNLNIEQVNAFMKSIWVLGVKGKERVHYWKLILWALFRRPRFFALSVTLAICGFHFSQVAKNIISLSTNRNVYEYVE
jgi:hypothetical protein